MQFKIQKPSIKCDRANLFYGYHNIVRLTTKTGIPTKRRWTVFVRVIIVTQSGKCARRNPLKSLNPLHCRSTSFYVLVNFHHDSPKNRPIFLQL